MSNPKALRIRAGYFDLARSIQPHPDYLKQVVENLGALGFNMMMLNLEHRFDCRSAPGMAPPGSLDHDGAQRLVEVGRKAGVEVVPQVNLMGHCEGIGATERYAHLTADPYLQQPWGGYEMLDLRRPSTQEMVAAMIDDVAQAFPGEWFGLGGDEVRQLGHLLPGDETAQKVLLRQYFQLLLDLGRRTGRRLIVWGDMPLHYPDLMQSLPRDMVIADWHYGPEGSRTTLETYKQQGFQVLAAGAINTCGTYALDARVTQSNLHHMIGDAVDLGLLGSLVTCWEFGFGSGFDLLWPWLHYAAELAQGRQVDHPQAFISQAIQQRYGCRGEDYLALVDLMQTRLVACLWDGRSTGPRPNLVRLRKSLFRAADPFTEPMRKAEAPPNRHQQVWEISPFWTWLYLRPILSPTMIQGLVNLAREAGELAQRIERAATQRQSELVPLMGLARALDPLAQRIVWLEEAQKAYHRAALAQNKDRTAFEREIRQSIACVQKLRPGLDQLRAYVKQLDQAMGLPPEELVWLDVHQRSLEEHLAALGRLRFESDALLEFGEFLRRPANVSPRLTWR